MGNDYSFNSDVWALGVIVVECALGHYPYCKNPCNFPYSPPFYSYPHCKNPCNFMYSPPFYFYPHCKNPCNFMSSPPSLDPDQ